MPSLNFGDAPVWLQWVLGIAAIAAVIGAGFRAIPPAWRFVKAAVSVVNELTDLPQDLEAQRRFRVDTALTLAQQNTTLAKQDQKIAEIHHEVHFNNGSSVKDATARIEKGVAGLFDEIEALKDADADIRRDFENTKDQENNS